MQEVTDPKASLILFVEFIKKANCPFYQIFRAIEPFSLF